MAFSIDPHLEDKSLLVFEFKKTDGGTFRRQLPFIENITIKEAVESNYSEYTPIGSNGSIFAYLGAKSRKLDLDFNITLPNIQEHTLVTPTAASVTTSKIGTRGAYFVTENFGDINKANTYASLISSFDTAFSDSMTINEKKLFKEINPKLAEEVLPNPSSPLSKAPGSTASPTKVIQSERMKSIYQVMYWVNLIRSCVLTNSKRPYLGPPIVTLTHGIMFMNIPCICESYGIDSDEEAGYDPITLLPRRLKITLSLREVRLKGGDFAPNGDDKLLTPGWDSLYDEDKPNAQGYPTMDPGGTITL
jgi:hypothetical protein